MIAIYRLMELLSGQYSWPRMISYRAAERIKIWIMQFIY
jgi:hypothetical protein